MKINDLVEMAIPVAQGEKVWKEINDLLNQDKYKEAAQKFIDAGGNPRGAKRTWNVAQANTKIAGGKVPGPIYGIIDAKHDYDKFLAAMPGDASAPKKNKVKQKDLDPITKSEEQALSYKTMADKRKVQSLQVKDGTAAGSDLARKMGKTGDNDPAKTLEADSKRFGDVAKGITEIKRLEAKDADPDQTMTPADRKKLATLKRETLEYRSKTALPDEAKAEFAKAETSKQLETALKKYIKKKVRVDDRETVVMLLNKIRKVSAKAKAVELHLLLKQVFRNKNNQKSIDDLIAKYEKNVNIGIAHLKGVDKVLDKYNAGKDISSKELEGLYKEVVKMLPDMSQNKKYDLKGFSTYSATAKKLSDFIDKKVEPTADDLEELLDGLANYHNNLKPKRKKNLKEDILFNLI